MQRGCVQRERVERTRAWCNRLLGRRGKVKENSLTCVYARGGIPRRLGRRVDAIISGRRPGLAGSRRMCFRRADCGRR